MKAKLIYEVFKDESDPIRDMGIGGTDPSKEFDKLRLEFLRGWTAYLRSLDAIGKSLTGNFHKGITNAPIAKYTIKKLKDIKIDTSLQITRNGLRFIDEDGTSYFYMIADGGKIFIE